MVRLSLEERKEWKEGALVNYLWAEKPSWAFAAVESVGAWGVRPGLPHSGVAEG